MAQTTPLMLRSAVPDHSSTPYRMATPISPSLQSATSPADFQHESRHSSSGLFFVKHYQPLFDVDTVQVAKIGREGGWSWTAHARRERKT